MKWIPDSTPEKITDQSFYDPDRKGNLRLMQKAFSVYVVTETGNTFYPYISVP